MAAHYNAFISYRHHPEDIRVATQIHRALERFRVPKTIRKKAKLPLRLFRDKDELPITSNLSDDIFDALQNSDYLIVICSVHTKESMWVQREIETFLKTHSRDKVLTVLVSGEPYDVIPEILLYQDTVDPETGETSRIPMEPLSCDWRMGRRKAMREELPRLAAALLHCGYDELRQRQRQYRMRQLIAVFSVALAASLALTAYFLYTTITIRNANIQIQENLDQALRNQSEFLATAAREKLEKGDRLTAIALLLEALPNEENPRPYVAEAEYALVDALGVYAGEYEMAAKGALIPSGSAQVLDFVQTEDRETIYLEDFRYLITVWDVQTLQKICTIDPGETIDRMIGPSREGGIILLTLSENELQCYSREGKLLWRLDTIQDAVLSEDGNTLYAIRCPDWNVRELLTVDSHTGELTAEILPLDPMENGETVNKFLLERIKEGHPVPIQYAGSKACLVDLSTGQRKALFTAEHLIRTACVTEDEKYLFMVSDGSGMMNGTFGKMNTTSPSGSDIFCYDQSGNLLWTSKITTCSLSSTHTLCPVPESSWIFCQSGDTLQLIDAVDGSIVQSCNAVCPVTAVSYVEAEYVMGFLQDGSIIDYNYETNLCNASYYYQEEDLRKAEFGKNIYTLSSGSTQVTVYQFQELLNEWELELTPNSLLDTFRTRGDLLALRMGDEICLLDAAKREFRWRIPREYRNLYDFSEDGTLLWAGDGYYDLISMDTATGEIAQYEIPRWRGDLSLNFKEQVRQFGDEFWFLASAEQKLLLCRFDPATGENTYYEIFSTDTETPNELANYAESLYFLEYYIDRYQDSDDESFKELMEEIEQLIEELPEFLMKTEEARLAAVEGGRAWVLSGTGELYEVDLETGKSRILLTELTHLPPIAVRESDGAVAIAAETEILLYVPGEEAPVRVDLEYERGGSLYFRGDELLVISDTGYLLRYDSQLRQLGRTELTVSRNFNTDLFSKFRDITDITWEFCDNGMLFLNLFNFLNVVNCNEWEIVSCIPWCMMYHEAGDQFLCSPEFTLRGYPRYDTGELIELAWEQLGTFQLSEEQKNAYGID